MKRAPANETTVPIGEARFASPFDCEDPPAPDCEGVWVEDVWEPEEVLLPEELVLDPEGGVVLISVARISATLSTGLVLSSELR